MKYLRFTVPFLIAATMIPAAAQGTSSSMPKPAATASAPTARVAVIAFQAAVSQTNEFQRDFADLQKKYDPRRQEIKSLSDQVDAMTKQLQSDDARLTDDERAARSHAIDEKKRLLDRDTQDAQSDFQSDMQDLMNRVAGKVGAVMTDYAQKHGYTLGARCQRSTDPNRALCGRRHKYHQGRDRRVQSQVGYSRAACRAAGIEPTRGGCAATPAGGTLN